MPRILLVEDDRDVRVLVEHVLIREGYHVDPAPTLAAARTLLANHHYQLVLADAALPDGTSFPIADEAERRGIPVVIMTAYAFRYAKEALARFDVLLKPVRPAEILEAVGNALRASQSLSQKSRHQSAAATAGFGIRHRPLSFGIGDRCSCPSPDLQQRERHWRRSLKIGRSAGQGPPPVRAGNGHSHGFKEELVVGVGRPSRPMTTRLLTELAMRLQSASH